MKHSEAASTQRAVVFTTESFNRPARTFALLREIGNPAVKTATAQADLISALDKFDNQLHTMNRAAVDDESRREVGAWKAMQISRLMMMRQAVVEIAAKDKAAAEARREGLLSVPPVADATSAIIDGQRRDSWARLPDEQKTRLRAELQSGKRDDLLLSLARDPLGVDPDSQFAASIWRTRMEQVNASAIAECDSAAEGANAILVNADAVESALNG